MITDIHALTNIVGVLAFTVSVITQVIKEVKPLKDIPTNVVVILLSIVLTLTSTIAWVCLEGIQVTSTIIGASVVGGFFVAFVTMFGWDKLNELYKRFKGN